MARTTVARRRNVTPEGPIASQIVGSGRDLLRRVMAGLRDRYDQAFAVWCRENGVDRDQVRAGLLGASRTSEAVEGARKAMRAVGIDEQQAA